MAGCVTTAPPKLPSHDISAADSTVNVIVPHVDVGCLESYVRG